MPLIYLPAFYWVRVFSSFSKVSSVFTARYLTLFTNTALTTFYSSYIFSRATFYLIFLSQPLFLIVSLFRMNFSSISFLFRNIVSIRIFYGNFKYFYWQSMFIFCIASTFFLSFLFSFISFCLYCSF